MNSSIESDIIPVLESFPGLVLMPVQCSEKVTHCKNI